MLQGTVCRSVGKDMGMQHISFEHCVSCSIGTVLIMLLLPVLHRWVFVSLSVSFEGMKTLLSTSVPLCVEISKFAVSAGEKRHSVYRLVTPGF